MKEAPIYFSGPNDEVPVVDPYEEFEVIEVDEEEEPEDNKVDEEEIIVDDSEEEELTIDDVVERTGESLSKPADAIKDLNDDIIDGIVDGVNDAVTTPTDFFHDLDGIKHTKDQFLDFGDLVDVIKGVESVFGILCVNGVNDSDFKNPYTGNTLKDLLNKGLFSFADCFLEKGTTEGLHSAMQDAVISAGKGIISSDGMSTVAWVDKTLDKGVTSLLDDSFAYGVVSDYVRPPSNTSTKNELDRIQDSLNTVNNDWFRGNSGRLTDDIEYRNLDTIKNASNDVKEVLDHSLEYLESISVADSYEIETEFNNYHYSF